MITEGQCPECTYSLQGLTTPRCPECGVELHPRLLAEPALAIPRPAWERRPRVSRSYAFWRTFWDITRHPRQFFGSMQYPDRLRRAVRWYFYMLLIASASAMVLAWATQSLLAYYGFLSNFPGNGVQLVSFLGAEILWQAQFGVAIIALPVIVLLLSGDVLLWHDRARFRLFAKTLLYSHVVYVWFVLFFIPGVGASLSAPYLYHIIPWTWYAGLYAIAWSNWVLAGVLTWQYALVCIALGGRRFAALQPPRRYVRTALVVLVFAAWILGIYLALFDCLLGWRYVTGMWGALGL